MTEMKAAHRKASNAYANYGRYYVRFDKKDGTFSCGYEGRGEFLRGVKLTFAGDCGEIEPSHYSTEWLQPDFEDYTLLTVNYGDKRARLRFKVRRDGIYIETRVPKGYAPHFVGVVSWGEGDDCFAARLSDGEKILRSAVGPAVSADDNALFDRATDSAAVFCGGVRLSYDWEGGQYRAELSSKKWNVSVRERVYADGYAVPYRPINKHNTFPAPPVGWMTWYSVMFDACEEAVLSNAEIMKKLFADYGANAVWVDWEWYHSAFDVEGEKGIDYFRPDPVRYPHGLRYVADRIESMGLTPALWIGITHEPSVSEFMEKFPDAVLAKDTSWCGEYFYDVTHPDYLTHYLPQAAQIVRDWHYRALKWDCLPITLWQADRYHEFMYDPSLTSERALGRAVKTVREILGDDFYMLSCAGAADREIRFAADVFDGARIGGDIFTWRDFINHLINRVVRFYLYHNVLLYCDPDNVVLREEHNNYDQAVSRASLVSALGLPFTMGDDLRNLPAERVDIIKRCIPPLDAHPCDIGEGKTDGNVFVVNQAIAKPFEQWNVIDVLNYGNEPAQKTLTLSDLHLGHGKYLLFEFWSKEFCGITDGEFTVNLRPYQSKVIAVRRLRGIPQILSTSRHISAGGVDLLEVHYDEKTETLYGVSEAVKDDKYTLYAYDPFAERIVTASYMPTESGKLKWEIKF